jgi:hypothetical protein
MQKHFSAYPKNWGLKRPDKNIDHRRVPNLQVFFRRHGTELPVSKDGQDYREHSQKVGMYFFWLLLCFCKTSGSIYGINITLNQSFKLRTANHEKGNLFSLRKSRYIGK